MTAILHISAFLDIRSVLMFLLISLLIYCYVQNKLPKHFPPGPRPLPFLGDLHHIDFGKLHLEFFKVTLGPGHSGATMLKCC